VADLKATPWMNIQQLIERRPVCPEKGGRSQILNIFYAGGLAFD
jgi:hypothetical protein